MKEVHVNYDNENQNFTHEFNIINEKYPDSKVTRLLRTNSNSWSASCRGAEAVRVVDNGDTLKISIAGHGSYTKEIELEFYEAEEVFIMLMQQRFAEIEIKETKTTMKWPLSQ